MHGVFASIRQIGAEGANSLVRREMGTPYMSWMYGQMGVVATLELDEAAAPNETAWQRFIPGGPVALLPLGSNISSLVWSVPVDRSKQLLKMTSEEFVFELNNALDQRYPQSVLVREASGALRSALRLVGMDCGSTTISPPRIKAVAEGSRAAFPLGFGHSSSYVQDRVALIGDAAHRVHPLAGQGVNLGFGDAATLSTLLGDAVYRGAEIG
ncbi:ubiquinone biosynthesis monooxygenase COQ6, mitochondrial-like [Ctenocephalides felis]|uniref:ubiquinone biosynthesis monooxygenase COQ6, mitochondrial-like n=1 Tax=Ctenocephalides felis TaxID=7515 RepID=UPI000E6E3046|nr:ubiquinone biosynthesis monooxygenase COQ6, mitochondrial-like [Ctenocephalides felis]